MNQSHVQRNLKACLCTSLALSVDLSWEIYSLCNSHGAKWMPIE